jgi:flagellar assembly protein FliH
MTNASRFLFAHDFRAPLPDAKQQAALAAAEERGRAAGFAAGLRQAQDDAAAQLASALRRLAETAASLLSEADARAAALEDEAIGFALDLGRKLAGEALRVDSLSTIAEAARATFQHLRGVPHLVARVNLAQVEDVERMLQDLAREGGFEGRLVMLGEPDIAPGDARLEWADGGVVRTRSRIDAALDPHLGARRAPLDDPDPPHVP